MLKFIFKEHAALHVVMGATHAFDNSLIDTVIQHYVNPIEKAERSLLIMATILPACRHAGAR